MPPTIPRIWGRTPRPGSGTTAPRSVIPHAETVSRQVYYTVPVGPPGYPAAADIVYGDAAYGSRDNVAACARAGIVPGILHGINLTVRGKGPGAAWGVSVRNQLGGISSAPQLDLLSQEEKRKNQTYWRTKIGYNMRRVAEGAFSIFKRVLGEHVMSLQCENIIREVRLKVALYSKWRGESIARDLERGVTHMA